MQAIRTSAEILKLKRMVNNSLKMALLLKEDKKENGIPQGLPFLL